MGNNIIQTESTPQQAPQKTQQQYSYISQSKQNIVGKPRIVKSNFTNLQLQEYYVSNSQSSIQYDSNIYKLRSSSYSKNIAVIFYHKILDEQQKLFKVRVQKMKGRLNQIDGLTYIEGLCLLQAGLNGFVELVYHAKTPFVITQKMIAINQNSQVRVWLNQNFALNKIMPGIKIRNQNIMIHQIFSAISEHIVLEQRQIFNDFRFKIAQCQRLIQAKNIITISLQNTNRKAIIQQLIEKQIRKISQYQHNHNQFQNQNQNPGQNTNNYSNGNTNININTIKIPMNFIPASALNNGQNSINPIGSYTETAPSQRVHIFGQQYIKDDEGSDRIRMIRQQYNQNTKSFIKNPINPSFQLNHKPINSKQVFHQQHRNKIFNQINQVNSNNQKNNIIITNIQNQSVVLRQQQKVSSIQPEQLSERNTQRVTTIFGSKKNQSNLQTNNNIHYKTLSPLKSKPANEYNNQNRGTIPTTSTLTNKIALSQNKITQMEKKINKLKQQFSNKNSQRKHDISYTSQIRNDQNDRIRIAVTPPHQIITPRSPRNQDLRPGSKYQKVFRLKSDSNLVENINKIDKKLSDALNKQLNRTMDDKKIQTNLNYKTQRNSQIFYQQSRNLKGSMIAQAKGQQLSKNPAHNKNLSPFRNQLANDKKGQDRDKSPSFNQPEVKISNTPIIINKNTSIYTGHRLPHHQHKVNINFYGNPYISNVNNSYTNTNGISFGGLIQNKSSILPRNSHF